MGRKSRAKQEKRQQEQVKTVSPNRTNQGGLPCIVESVCLKIIHFATYLLLFVPLLVSGAYFFPFVAPKGLFLMALIEIAFFSWLILAFLNRQYRPQRNILFWALTIFLIFLTLATIFGQDPSRSFWSNFERMSGLLMWLHLFGFFMVASSVFKKKDWLRIFLISIAVAIIVCFLFWATKLGIKNLPTGYNGSTLGNSSFLATYLLFNIFFAFYLFAALRKEKEFSSLFFAKTKKPYLLVVLFALIMMLITLMFSTGRAAILAFFGGLALLAILYWALEVKNKSLRQWGRITLIFSLIIFIAGIIILHWPNSIAQQWLSERSLKSRQAIWENAVQGLKERPVLGWGPENFSFVFDQHFNPGFYLPAEYGPDVRFDRAHNIIFDNLIDAGLTGLFAYLFILGAAFWVLGRAYLKNKLDFWTAALPAVLLVAHFVQNLTVFDMPASFLMFFLTLSFISAVSPKIEAKLKEKQEKRMEPKKITFAVLLVVAMVLILFIYSLTYFVVRPSKVATGLIKIMASPNYEIRIPAYKQTFYSSSMGKYQIRSQLSYFLFGLAEQHQLEEQDVALVSAQLEQSVSQSPLDYWSHLTLGKLYNLYAEVDKTKILRAEQVLGRAREIAPFRQDVYWELSKTEALLGKKQESLSWLEKAIELEPRVAYSHLLMISVARGLGEEELAKTKANQAIEIIPDLASQIEQIFKMEVPK